jgi:formate--tetrahydrofolate ligase
MPASQHQNPKQDIEIAREADIKPIHEVAAKLGLAYEDLQPYGHHKAKISLDYINGLQDRKDGKLILVAGINPTKAG